MRLAAFLDSINEAKFRKPRVMYHGTSITNLRSILKQGIVPDPKDKVWATDPDVGKSSLSRESLPGSYWTSNLGTATSSSTTARKQFGDDQLIIIALISEGSASADEDSINAALLRGFGAMYEELFQGGIVMDEIPKISSLAYWGKGYGHEHKNYAPEMLQSYAKYVHNELSANPDKQPLPMELMKELMETMMLRALAYSDEKEGGKWSRDQYVKEIERLADEGQAPRWQPLAQMEQLLLRLREKLTKYYTKTAFHDESMFSHTLRTEEPVTYRGANRIIGIIVHRHDYKQPRILYYGTLPDDYRTQYEQRVGPNRGIVDPQGNVIEPSEVQDEPEQVAASVGMTEAARAGKRYYLNGHSGEHFMYPSSSGNFPSTVLVPIDTQDLKTATNVVVVRFNPRNMKKLMNELARPSLVRTEEQERIFRIYQEAIDDRNMRPYLNMMNEMPYTRLVELNGRDRIYKYIITDLKQQVATFQSIFGEVPELGESHFTPFHNAQLFIPDNMRPASKKIALTVLEEVYDSLQRIGADVVFGGHIIIMPLTADGEYVAKTGEIRMNANTKDPMRAAVVLLHEYGHKLQYEFMTPKQVKMLRTKYIELLRQGESHMGNIDFASEAEHLISQIKVGMPVKYVGRGKKGWGSNPNYVVVGFGKTAKGGNPGVTIADDAPGKFVRGTIAFSNILNSKRWKLPFEGITTQLAHAKPSDEWFPTKYSMSDEAEWWAELFSFYAMGNLKGEPVVWIKKFLADFGKQQVAASVGSNEGEVDEEPDQTDSDMNPKEIVPKSNALADAGTSSGWDWTDPQHGTAPDNAVMSHTP